MSITNKLCYEKDGIIGIGSEQGNCIGLWGVAVNPQNNMVYVSNIHTPNLAVIDGDKEKFVKTITLTQRFEQYCSDICFNPVNKRFYVTSQYFNKLWTVDANADDVAGEYELPNPAGVAVDTSTGITYVALSKEAAVAILDRDDNVIKKIMVKPWVYSLAVDSERHLAYAVSQIIRMAYQNYPNPIGFPPGVLSVIDTQDNRVIGEFEIDRRCHGISVNPKTGLVYVSSRADDSVLVFDPLKKSVIKRLKTQCHPFGMSIDPDRDKLYVVNLLGECYDDIGQPATVTVIDTQRNEVVKHFPIGKYATSIAVNSKIGRAYTANEDDMDVSIIDTDHDVEIRRVSGFGLTVDGMEINPRTHRMYIPTHFTKGIRTVDTNSREIIGDIIVGGWGTDCAINEEIDHIYFNNSQTGTVHVINGETNSEVASCNLGVGSTFMRRLWGGIACNQQRSLVYAVMARQNGVAILQDKPEKNQLLLLGRIDIGPLHMFNPDLFPGAMSMPVVVNTNTGMVYVYNTFRKLLSQINPKDFTVTAQVDLSSLLLPIPDRHISGYLRKYNTRYILAVDEKRNLIYANNFIIDGETMRIVRNLPIDKVTGVLAIDNKKNRLYTHGRWGLTIMNPETYEEILSIPHNGVEAPDTELRVQWGVDCKNDKIYLQRHMFMKGNEIEVYNIRELQNS